MVPKDVDLAPPGRDQFQHEIHRQPGAPDDGFSDQHIRVNGDVVLPVYAGSVSRRLREGTEGLPQEGVPTATPQAS